MSPHQPDQLAQLLDKCIVGSHILHYHGILDAFGHLSFRHPTKPDVFVMPRNMAPANVASPKDLVEYNVSNAAAVDTNAPRGYIERYIHSEIYKKYPAVNSVIHSHSNAVVPYTITGVPLKACIHIAGFLGHSTPVYDISKHYPPDGIRDLLIRSPRLGESLAACFSSKGGDASPSQAETEQAVVLMRGHGYTVVGDCIEECVMRAIYTNDNAVIQTTSIGLKAAYHSGGDIEYLREDELGGAKDLSHSGWDRAWGLWVREVEAAQLYVKES